MRITLNIINQFTFSYIIMKPCHICERIIRIEKAYRCDACSKAFCLTCINQHFHSTFKHSTKTQNTGAYQCRLSPCFACRKECKCLKCTTRSFVVNKSSSANENLCLSTIKQELVGLDEPIPDSGLFKNIQINELSTYLQRIYLKKKSIYSKHRLFQHQSHTLNQDHHNEAMPQKQKDQSEYLQGKEVDESFRFQDRKQKIDEQRENADVDQQRNNDDIDDNDDMEEEMGEGQISKESQNREQDLNDEVNMNDEADEKEDRDDDGNNRQQQQSQKVMDIVLPLQNLS